MDRSGSEAMSRENMRLVAHALVEVQDFGKFTAHFRGKYRIYLDLLKKIQKMSTCNQLDLETLGSSLVMLKFSPITGRRCSQCISV